jgi:hypothetical protein
MAGPVAPRCDELLLKPVEHRLLSEIGYRLHKVSAIA